VKPRFGKSLVVRSSFIYVFVAAVLSGRFWSFECRAFFEEQRFFGTGKGGETGLKLDLLVVRGGLQRASWPQVDQESGLIMITSSSCC